MSADARPTSAASSQFPSIKELGALRWYKTLVALVPRFLGMASDVVIVTGKRSMVSVVDACLGRVSVEIL